MVEQSSLESKFNEQESSNPEKFMMAEPLKRCNKCGILKSLSEFDKYRHRTSRYKACKDCRRTANRERYQNLPEEGKKVRNEHSREWYNAHNELIAEQRYLYHKTKRSNAAYFAGTGICLVCGELQPLSLENHHVIPKEDTVVSLCGSCHNQHRSRNQDAHMISVLNAIENSKFLWDSDGQPKGLKPVPMWTADTTLKEAIEILKSYDLPGYEPVEVEV